VSIEQILDAVNSKVWNAHRAVEAYKASLQRLSIRSDKSGDGIKILRDLVIWNALYLQQVTIEVRNLKK